MGSKPVWTAGSHATIGLSVLQIIFAVVVAVVTKASLADQPIPGESSGCVLNLAQGELCDFAYVSVGFGLLFSLLLLGLTLFSLLRTARAAGPIVAQHSVHLALFGFLWWFVFAMTAAIRGHQATEAGYPQTAARNAVVGLSWIVAAFYLFIAVAGIADQVKNAVPAESDTTATFLSKKEDDTTVAHTQVGSLQV